MSTHPVIVIPTSVRAAIPQIGDQFRSAILALSEPAQALPAVTCAVQDAIVEAGLAHDAALAATLTNALGLRDLHDLVRMVRHLVLVAETRVPGPLPQEFDTLMCQHFSSGEVWQLAFDGARVR